MSRINNTTVELSFTPQELELIEFARVSTTPEAIRSMLISMARSRARMRCDEIARVSYKRNEVLPLPPYSGYDLPPNDMTPSPKRKV